MYGKNGIFVVCVLVALRRENALLRQQRDVLKKLWASSSNPEQRYQGIFITQEARTF
jgi:hypothetical protein